ncbi:MAG: hypothetical protein QOK40_1656 [Miltoncostaeaceae bacterium]|jgi:hypothetical protein|nr:hypothetical protein [Miltoncostaeaceae bacterium]
MDPHRQPGMPQPRASRLPLLALLPDKPQTTDRWTLVAAGLSVPPGLDGSRPQNPTQRRRPDSSETAAQR